MDYLAGVKSKFIEDLDPGKPLQDGPRGTGAYMCVYICVCTYVCVSVCMYVCVYVGMYGCRYVDM